MGLTFKGQSLPSYVTLREKARPYKAPVTWESFKIPYSPGVLLGEKSDDPIVIPCTFQIEGATNQQYERNVEKFSAWLDSDKAEPLVFLDNPLRTYYAVVQGEFKPSDELNVYGVVTVDFFCPKPYKYGPVITSDFINGLAVVPNDGSIKVKPTVNVNVLEDISYLDIFTDYAYMRIGKPPSEGQIAIKPETLVFNNPMTNLTGWTSAGTSVDGGVVAGSFTVAGGGFKASSFGSGEGWHGPSLKQSIPNGPLTDFRIEHRFTFPTEKDKYGRIELYMLDDLNNTIGKIAMKQNKATTGNTVEVRLGGGSAFEFIYTGAGTKGFEWNDFDGIITLSKKGNEFEVYIAEIDPSTGKHHSRSRKVYVDNKNQFTKPISQIQIHSGIFGTSTSAGPISKDIKVYRYNEVPDSDPNIIAGANDFIQFDFAKSAIYINGKERKDLKSIAASFFSLNRGDTVLQIEPSASVNANVEIREGWK